MTIREGPIHLLFVCTHNSARSQMAEGMLRAWGGDQFEAFSAGTEATQVRSEAFRSARDAIRDRLHMFMLAAGREDLPHPEPRRIGA